VVLVVGTFQASGGHLTLGKLLAGIDQPDAGEIAVDGRVVHFEDPRDALLAGIGMVHQELAFCENLSVAENLCLGDLPGNGVFVSRGEMFKRAEAMLAAIDAPIDARRLVGELTVAEQQMVQIAAAVGSGARVIIFDEPTRGVDVGAITEIHQLINRLADEGKAVVVISSYLPEVMSLSDRILVLHEGRLSGEIDGRTATEEQVMTAATGQQPSEVGADAAMPA